MKALTILSLALLLQLGCQSIGTTKVELAQEEVEAQRLVDAGIDFKFTSMGDGPAIRTGCGYTTAHTYKSSDGIAVDAPNTSCTREDEAALYFEAKVKESSEIFSNEVLFDAEQRPIGKRHIGARQTSQYYEYRVITLRGTWLPEIYSPSLRHILAFEKWRAAR